MKKVWIASWLFVLIIEMLWFYDLIHSVHETDDVLFIITLVFVSLVVGIVVTFAPKEH